MVTHIFLLVFVYLIVYYIQNNLNISISQSGEGGKMYHKIFISIDKTTYFTSKLAIELSHYIGFKSVAMEFPLFTSDRDLPDDILCFIINENMDDHFHVEAMNNLVTVGISASENSVRNAYEYL